VALVVGSFERVLTGGVVIGARFMAERGLVLLCRWRRNSTEPRLRLLAGRQASPTTPVGRGYAM
jgi:hypothetical protein